MIKYVPFYAIIELTRACNFKCLHCGASAGKPLKEELSFEELKLAINDLKTLQCQGISLMGGEILLRKDWPDIAQYIINSGINCSIITNGYFLTDQIVKQAKNIGVIQIGISLDAANSKTHYKIRGVRDSFEKALEAIKLSHNNKIKYTTVITAVSKLNINELSSIFDLLKPYDNIDWQIKLVSSHNKKRLPDNHIVDASDYIHIADFIKNTANKIKEENLELTISGAHDLGYYSNEYPEISKDWTGCVAGIAR